MRIWFLKKTPQTKFYSSFGFDSALKTIDAQMFLWSVFLKMHNKSYWLSKTPFWPFLAVNNVFLCVFINTDQNNICASIVFKAKTKEKYEEIFFYSFYFKTQKCPFWGSTNFFLNFFSVLAFKTIDTPTNRKDFFKNIYCKPFLP